MDAEIILFNVVTLIQNYLDVLLKDAIFMTKLM